VGVRLVVCTTYVCVVVVYVAVAVALVSMRVSACVRARWCVWCVGEKKVPISRLAADDSDLENE
jgi:hypothetical protein